MICDKNIINIICSGALLARINKNLLNIRSNMTKILTTNNNTSPWGSLRAKSHMPALFNENWLEDIFSSFDNWDKAFDLQNVHYPYDVSVKKNDRDIPLEYRLDIALAGVSKTDIRLSVKESQLLIEISKPSSQETEDKVTWLKNGISRRAAKLQFSLGKDVDIKNISSSFKDGLLRVVIPVIQPDITDININVD